MTDDPERPPHLSRRAFLGTVAGAAAGAAALGTFEGVAHPHHRGDGGPAVPFYGARQSGITTPQQAHTQFASFDVLTDDRGRLADLLRTWTDVSAALAAGRPAPPSPGADADSGEAAGLGPSRLTVTFGFGPSLFGIGGPDRFGLRRLAPTPLVDLPPFPGDQLTDSGGDLTLHVCADDAQVAFHALRQLRRAAAGAAGLRWVQTGFSTVPPGGGTPRNLLGFKDGTSNPVTTADMATTVWVGEEGPDWMTGGTYGVVRRIRVDLERWDRTSVAEQQRVIGRFKASGAPLGRSGEFTALDLGATDGDGRLVIPPDAHVRQASPQQNWGARILRRSYQYDNGAVTIGSGPVADAGVLFCCYQRFPVVAFIPIYEKLAVNDALSRFTTHTGSAIFAVPAGVAGPGDWVGRRLLQA